MKIEPYVFFNGRCDEAIEFYREALGAEVQMLVRFKDNPEPPPSGIAPGTEDKVMHATLKIGEATILASDGHCQGKPTFEGFGLSITATSEDDAHKYFNALANGGNVQMPLSKTFFSSCFGMLSDRFGILWMVITQQ
jgi:PhnB protein